jgi:hypothetical protein
MTANPRRRKTDVLDESPVLFGDCEGFRAKCASNRKWVFGILWVIVTGIASSALTYSATTSEALTRQQEQGISRQKDLDELKAQDAAQDAALAAIDRTLAALPGQMREVVREEIMRDRARDAQKDK